MVFSPVPIHKYKAKGGDPNNPKYLWKTMQFRLDFFVRDTLKFKENIYKTIHTGKAISDSFCLEEEKRLL